MQPVGTAASRFKLMLHNDSAIWGASSNEVVKMVYDDQDWAIFGSISGDTTHIALRAALRAEIPIVNSASTDPTIVETIIPWYFSVLQDDRTQGYTLARHIYTDLGLEAHCAVARERPLRTIRSGQVSRCLPPTGPPRGDRAEVLSLATPTSRAS